MSGKSVKTAPNASVRRVDWLMPDVLASAEVLDQLGEERPRRHSEPPVIPGTHEGVL